MPKELISMLQKVQNAAVRVIFKKRKFESVSEDLNSLHWLKIEPRIVFKALLLIFKCLSNTAPKLLVDLLQVKSIDPLSIHYRKLNEHFLPAPISSLGHKAFQFYAPRLWNNLPRHITYILDITCFKTTLKTYLFSNFLYYKNCVNRYYRIL